MNLYGFNGEQYCSTYNVFSNVNQIQKNSIKESIIGPNVPIQLYQSIQNDSSLWMGNLMFYMDKTFIFNAFIMMGVMPLEIHVIYNDQIPNYAFIDFEDPTSVLQKLTGQIIPGTNPPIRFNLHFGGKRGNYNISSEDFTVWVGNLGLDTDSNQLYEFFASYYRTIKSTRVVSDSNGNKLGYGFIRFGSKEEQEHCLNHMNNNIRGLSTKPIQVRVAKRKLDMFLKRQKRIWPIWEKFLKIYKKKYLMK